MEVTKIFTIDIKKWTKSELIPYSHITCQEDSSVPLKHKKVSTEFSVSDSELRYGYQEIMYVHPENFTVFISNSIL